MKIIFKNKDLERCAIDESFALKHMGKKRALIYTTRIAHILIAKNFEELREFPGRFHELSGNRKGQWACSLDQPYRLIIQGSEPDEVVVWTEVTEAEIKEIVDYH